MYSFYRKFILQFSKITASLHHLTRKNFKFQWTNICEEAFLTHKKRLCEAPVLAYPKWDRDFVLKTDASIEVLGAVLSQEQGEGLIHPVSFASHSLSSAECNYGITDLETLAVVWAVSHFHFLLYGHRVTVYTDHAAVHAVLEDSNPRARHARWWIQVYGSRIRQAKIVYHPGKLNASADALSQCPVSPPPTEGIGESEVQVASLQSTSLLLNCTIKELLRADSLAIQSTSLQEQRKDAKLLEIFKFWKRGNHLMIRSGQDRLFLKASSSPW